jgi:hypothetical protein
VKRTNLLVGLSILFLLFCLGSVMGQLQQSGGPGSTVSVGSALPVGANVIGKVTIDQTTPGTTNLVSVSNTGFNVTGSLPAGSAVIGLVKTIPLTACGTTAYDSNPTLLPTAATAVTATTTCIVGIYLTNIDTVAHTVTVTDGSTQCGGGVCTYVGPAFSIPGLSNMNIPLEGMKFTTGLKWNVTDASTNKVIGQAYGFQ